MAKQQKPPAPITSVEFSPDKQMTPEEKEQFLSENPTRMEVANFVSSYLSNEFLPGLLEYINSRDNRNLQLVSICQAVLISAGITDQKTMDTLLSQWEAAQKTQGQQGSTPPEKPTSPPGVIK
ncbi:MAG: hypothetical protein NC548_19860 [Lachnospiraceae bacterium]|nr:hypothetical protein [Lachnospiraceae bacterium]